MYFLCLVLDLKAESKSDLALPFELLVQPVFVEIL